MKNEQLYVYFNIYEKDGKTKPGWPMPDVWRLFDEKRLAKKAGYRLNSVLKMKYTGFNPYIEIPREKYFL